MKENKNIVELSKKITFEGKEYSEIDLSKLDELTTADLIQAQKILTRMGSVATVLETDYQYTMIIAHLATKLPLEFFDALPAKDGVKVKNRVSGSFFG